MKKSATIKYFLIAVFVLPVIAYMLISWYENKLQKLPVLGKPEQVNGKSIDHTIAAFSFTDQDGNRYNKSFWKNKIVVADFFFTHCPTICPKMTNSLKQLRAAYKNDETVLINSFTVDPENDQPEVLKKYADKFNLDQQGWKLLTGDKKEIYKLARNSFFITATDGDGGPGDFIHSQYLVLVDTQGRIRGYYDGTNDTETSQLIQDIKKLKHEN